MRVMPATVPALTSPVSSSPVEGSRYSVFAGAAARRVINVRSCPRRSSPKRPLQVSFAWQRWNCSASAASRLRACSLPSTSSFGTTPSITTARVLSGWRMAYCCATRVP